MHIIAQKSTNFVQILCRIMNTHRLFFLFTLMICTCGCNQEKYLSFKGYAQGGVYEVIANVKDASADREEIAAGIDSLLLEIDFSISGYNKNSLLSKSNAGEEIVPDRHFSTLCELSDKYNKLTNGAFDVKAAPLFDIWGFGFTPDSLPSKAIIEDALAESKKGAILNFNAIAQGYSCDVIAEYLRSLGIHDMLVNIGEIYCSGLNPDGKAWSIGIDTPTDGNNTPGQSLSGIWESEGKDCGIVTSGNYRKFYIKDGKKYAHTIDPRTGYPVEHDLLSATIVAESAAEADAIATACMVMGPSLAEEFIKSYDGVEAYFIYSEGSWASDGFKFRQ